MTVRGEVLVAILNNRLDFNLAYEQHWYRIPVSSKEKLLKHRLVKLTTNRREESFLVAVCYPA